METVLQFLGVCLEQSTPHLHIQGFVPTAYINVRLKPLSLEISNLGKIPILRHLRRNFEKFFFKGLVKFLWKRDFFIKFS